MATRTNWTRLAAAGAAVIASGLLSGCVSTVGGTVLRDPDAPKFESTLAESDLDGLLIPVNRLNDIVGSSDLEVNADFTELNDNSAAVSDIDCLGAAFGAQELVYGDSGWTAVRDQIVREPGADNPHWLEQAVVLYPSADRARNFFDASREIWDGCVGSIVTYDSQNLPLRWTVGEVTATDSSIGQMSTPEGSVGGGCHHAMSAAANVIVETWACGDDIVDQADTMARAIVARIDEK
ncbi:sensor domain-containing protein [Mycobacterium sp. NPDC003449]